MGFIQPLKKRIKRKLANTKSLREAPSKTQTVVEGERFGQVEAPRKNTSEPYP